ncbi:hypothetical protein KHQ81_15045 [Mycoplasmatota bacterium]|nr:hypothetical protein KHQ81_15045 [Mycoplasmatota bacterium]
MEQKKVVKIYEPNDYEQVMDFLQGVHTLGEIEEDLFENAVIIVSDEEIVGMITFEMFRNKALIRYFIFDRDVEEIYLVEMYEKFFENLKQKNMNKVFVIINNDNIMQMFINLGFNEFPKESFFLTEESILNTKYKDATVMFYEIEY